MRVGLKNWIGNNCGGPKGMVLVCVLAGAMAVAGCSSSKETKENEAPATVSLAKAEEHFKPSDYDRDPSRIREEDEHGKKAATEDVSAPKAISDTVRGFRVQVLFTKDFEQANQMRDTISSTVPEEYVYVVYDAPYYKVRVGNFVDRSDANPLLRTLIGDGYRDAWVVPDNVVTNLPRKQTQDDQH